MADDAFLDVMMAVVDSLDRSALHYAITGSMASSIHGEPQMSNDVDICLRMTPAQAERLANALPSRFYRSREAMVEAAKGGPMTNLIDMKTNLKVDLSVLASEPFYDQVLQRRQLLEYLPGGPSFWFVSAEDVILMKLVWRKDSRSQKQWENALSVVRCRGAQLDWSYLRKWAEKLDLLSDFEALASEGGV